MLETGNSYPGMLQKLYPLITKARKALKSQVPEVERRVTEMQFVLKDIGIIRTHETNPYLAKDFEEAFGFPLELTTGETGGWTYQQTKLTGILRIAATQLLSKR